MKIGKLIVDGTKAVIADGRQLEMHAIAKETDYTHQRVVGYARDLAQAHRFAASDDMLEALQLIATEQRDDGMPWARGVACAAIARATGEA